MLFTTLTSLLATLALAAPSKPAPRSTQIIHPVHSQYTVSTGAVSYNTGVGRIFKSPSSPSITTLLSFAFPASSAGKTCKLHFPLDASATSTGSQRAQVFSSLRPADQTTETWPDGNLRDQHLGDVRFVPGHEVIWEATYGIYASGPFPCPAGHKLGAELVGRWDSVDVTWDANLSGPFISYS